MAGPLNDAFEAALRGDRRALACLLSLLNTRYGQSVFEALRSRRGEARSGEIGDAGQISMAEFVEEIKAGAARELADAERRELVQYFTGLSERALEKNRKDTAVPRPKTDTPKPPADAGRVPPSPAREEQWRLLQGEIGALDAFDRLVLERYLAGVPYGEVAKETGRKVAALEVHVSRIKQRIADRLAQQGSAAARGTLPAREPSCAPRKQEILAALEDLPVEAQAAIDFVHVKGRSIVALAKTLGDRGLEKAQARLELGYESLARRLDIPFPESFEFLKL
jgi:DNA-directed RNA polymerase specialized sigma24 family protein